MATDPYFHLNGMLPGAYPAESANSESSEQLTFSEEASNWSQPSELPTNWWADDHTVRTDLTTLTFPSSYDTETASFNKPSSKQVVVDPSLEQTFGYGPPSTDQYAPGRTDPLSEDFYNGAALLSNNCSGVESNAPMLAGYRTMKTVPETQSAAFAPVGAETRGEDTGYGAQRAPPAAANTFTWDDGYNPVYSNRGSLPQVEAVSTTVITTHGASMGTQKMQEDIVVPVKNTSSRRAQHRSRPADAQQDSEWNNVTSGGPTQPRPPNTRLRRPAHTTIITHDPGSSQNRAPPPIRPATSPGTAFTCPQCPPDAKTHGRNADLTRHIKMKHGGEGGKFVCPNCDCDRAFNWEKDLVKHVETHKTNRTLIVCKLCGKKYTRGDNYLRHARNQHEGKK